MRCNVEKIEGGAENLESVLNKSWSVENIEAKDNFVIHDFEKYIFHNGRRFVTILLLYQVMNFYRIISQCVNKDLKN